MFYKKLFVSFRRRLSLLQPIQRVCSAKQWKPFDEDDVKNHVANIFQCSQSEANHLVNSVKKEFEDDRCGRIEILRLLKKKGFSIKNINSCKSILKQPLDAIQERIQFSSQAFEEASPPELISVLRLNDRDFTCLKTTVLNDKEKVAEFSKLFKCSHAEMGRLLIKHPFLTRSKMSTLQSKLDLLASHNISVGEARKDLWTLTYAKERIEGRINEIRAMNVDPIKPWMLRCLPDVLLRLCTSRQEKRKALSPHPDLKSYLASRLNISPEAVEAFAKRHPPVMRVQVTKMKEMIDYLMSEGYSGLKIVQSPRLLCHSFKTIQSRMNELKRRNYRPSNLSVLCKPKRSFDDFVRKVGMYKDGCTGKH